MHSLKLEIQPLIPTIDRCNKKKKKNPIPQLLSHDHENVYSQKPHISTKNQTTTMMRHETYQHMNKRYVPITIPLMNNSPNLLPHYTISLYGKYCESY